MLPQPRGWMWRPPLSSSPRGSVRECVGARLVGSLSRAVPASQAPGAVRALSLDMGGHRCARFGDFVRGIPSGDTSGSEGCVCTTTAFSG